MAQEEYYYGGSEDGYTKEQLENFNKFELELLGTCGKTGITTLANMAKEVPEIDHLFRNNRGKSFDTTVGIYDAVKYTTSAIDVANNIYSIANYVEKLENASDTSEKAIIRGNIMSDMFRIYGDVLSFSSFTGEFAFLFEYAADCLDYGLSVIQTRLGQLEYYDALIDQILNDDECDASLLNDNSDAISGTSSDISDLMTCIAFAQNAAAAMEVLGFDSLSMYSKIDDANSIISEINTLEDEIIEDINKVTGESYADLDAIAKAELEEVEKETTGAEKAKVDPLIIDINGNGFNIEKKKYGTYFDLNCNGFAEKINWTRQDAILAYDKNGNGVIDDGSEVFGDYHLLPDGSRPKNGFEALAQYDTNGNGIIDEEDEIFDSLKLWIDADGNGQLSDGELKSLRAMNIKSINLNYEHVNETTDSEALIGNVATVEYMDGSINKIGEMWVSSDLFDAIEKVIVSVTDDVNGLPNVRSYGTINSLHNAIMLDETGELKQLVENFTNEGNNETRTNIVERILHILCKTDEIESDSRGNYINAKNLAVIESFLGSDFMGINGSNPNSAAAPILNKVYNDLIELYCFAMIGSSVNKYMNYLKATVDENGYVIPNVDYFNSYLLVSLEFGAINEKTFSDICSYLGYYCSNVQNDYTIFNKIRQFFESNDSKYLSIIDNSVFGAIRGDDSNNRVNGTILSDVIYGNGGSDVINAGNGNDLVVGGSGNDAIYGGDGDDILYGDDGNDILDGGAGDDLLIDNDGDDIFVFTKGYGHDIIQDAGGRNTIRFKGLTPDDISVNGTGDYDVTITIKSTGETLVIKNFRMGDEFADYDLDFDGDVMHCTDARSPFRHIYGGNDNDVLKAVVDNSIMHAFGGDDVAIGSKGDDIIYGNSGNDTIYAGAGNDIIYGGSGSDILDGEAGDDVLMGGVGGDIYVFGVGYGTDIIDDTEGISTIRLIDGLGIEDVTITLQGGEAVISINNTDDRMIIHNYVGNEDKFVIEAGDEKTDIDSIISNALPETETNIIAGSSEYDYIIGGSENDIIFGGGNIDRILAGLGDDTIFGGYGNDQLFGEDGNDTIFGGTGDDYISGGAGNDVISGGIGNDFMDGGEGDDTYIFNLGDGSDSIKDSYGLNKIIFGDDIDTSSIKCYRTNWNDIMITFDGSSDTLTIKNYCIDKETRNFTLVFADGTVVNATDKDSPLRTIYGTNGSEYMASIYEDGITLIGQDGTDELQGSAGADHLYGGEGDDRIIGNSGDDILDGGTGRDYLAGGAGNDTYIYKAGYGIDTISDSEDVNYISISGYNRNDIKAYRTNWNNLTIVFGGDDIRTELKADGTPQDRIVIENFFTSEASRNFYLSFNGGGQIHATASNSPLRTIYSTSGNEYMLAMDDRGVTLIAQDGYNTLNGGNGNDYLYGGTGNDCIIGNGGNDTLDGGLGDDYLSGGAGNDIYIFNKSYGTDTIDDSQGINTIIFGAGLDKDNLVSYRTNWNDLTISFTDTEDNVVISGYFTDENRQNFNVQFADGSRYAYDDSENPISEAYVDSLDDIISEWDDFDIEAIEDTLVFEDVQTLKLTEDIAGFAAEDSVSDGIVINSMEDDSNLLNNQIIIPDTAA